MSERTTAKTEEYNSYRVGPLYADNSEVANEILVGLIKSVPQSPAAIFLETPGTNPSTATLVTCLGFTKTFAMTKMYRGTSPKHDHEKIYCYSSLVFG